MLDRYFCFCYPCSGMKNSLDNLYEISLLLDFYGALLSPRQQQILSLYHEENCSLQEISAELGISRQAVHDAIRKAENALRGYEEKLGLVARFQEQEKVLEQARASIDALLEQSVDPEMRRALLAVRNDIDSIEEQV